MTRWIISRETCRFWFDKVRATIVSGAPVRPQKSGGPDRSAHHSKGASDGVASIQNNDNTYKNKMQLCRRDPLFLFTKKLPFS
jgi:hypothetical protein